MRWFAVLVVSCTAPLVPGGIAAADTVVAPGDRSAEVERLQRKLHQGGFYWGRINGNYDVQTRYAVWTLQKSQGLTPRGEVSTAEWQALERPRRRRPLVPRGPDDRVEINLRTQLLTVYRRDRPVLVSHVSTGAGIEFCNGGRCRVANTPIGDFRVGARSPGWSTGALGSMFNAMYFNGGIAMHGSSQVPLRPASHGCVRLPLATSKRLFKLVGPGEPVYVRGAWHDRGERRRAAARHGRSARPHR
ncbi:L,D-transpeptidase family protein [Nonomuraea antri]|uniref:L,D-transpeptidase family protein n=1 Tax=Nonomuraea antri TaxID=2730852 RepID=UPI001F175CA6|nr:L,D-transpeptidase family protein [Nonomuraea antri]